MESRSTELTDRDRSILSFLSANSLATNAAVVAVNCDLDVDAVKERLGRLEEFGFVRTHSYFDRLYKITDDGEWALSQATSGGAQAASAGDAGP